MTDRLENLNLGVNLGWLEQGAGFGGRPIPEMTADLQRVAAVANALSYRDFASLVDGAAGALNTSQSPGSALGQVQSLITLFQGQASGIGAAALNLGIVLGWFQQGARADNRPVSLATGDLESARTHATSAGYESFDGYIGNALTKLTGGQPVASALPEATALIGLFQGQA
ncbi:MAG: hypothetical protein ACRDZW_10960 [Acidimicrobiales bacterium]